jgi:hypothetical protein
VTSLTKRMTLPGPVSAERNTHTMATREPIDTADAYTQAEAADRYESDWLAAFIHNILFHN